MAADVTSGIYVDINGTSGFTATCPIGYSGTDFYYVVATKNP